MSGGNCGGVGGRFFLVYGFGGFHIERKIIEFDFIDSMESDVIKTAKVVFAFKCSLMVSAKNYLQ